MPQKHPPARIAVSVFAIPVFSVSIQPWVATRDSPRIAGAAVVRMGIDRGRGGYLTPESPRPATSAPRPHLEQLIDLAGALADDLEEPPRELDYVLAGVCLEQGIAADDFLGLGERAIRHPHLAAGGLIQSHARRAELHALGREQPAFLHTALDQLAHVRHLGFGRGSIRG